MLEYAEASITKILQMIGENEAQASGKCVLLILAGDTVYRQYTRHFSTDRSTMESTGMWIRDSGGGQIVLRSLLGFKPTLAHELTHLHLAPRALPRWLEEGVAQRMARIVISRPRLSVGNIARQSQRGYWIGHDIQSFWSGTAFRAEHTTTGVRLAYELSELMVNAMVKEDVIGFQDFLRSASRNDAGEAASKIRYGFGLGTWLSRILGEGNWSPTDRLTGVSHEMHLNSCLNLRAVSHFSNARRGSSA